MSVQKYRLKAFCVLFALLLFKEGNGNRLDEDLVMVKKTTTALLIHYLNKDMSISFVCTMVTCRKYVYYNLLHLHV